MIEGVRVAFIVAAAENGVIGRNGDLPWRLPSDLRYFRKRTLGKPMIMGRKTYASIGRPLDGRDSIVLTRDRTFTAPGVIVVHDAQEALARGLACAKARAADEMQVIGGAEIFAALLPFADRLYLTRVLGRPDGDVTFTVDPALWRETAREPMLRTDKDDHDAIFITLDRVAPAPN